YGAFSSSAVTPPRSPPFFPTRRSSDLQLVIISSIAVKRPVFAIVISLLLTLLGLMAFQQMPVREYPDIDPPIVSVQVTYRGATIDRKSTRLNSSHVKNSYAVFCLKKKT